jgi:hypothetical protein
MDKFKLGDTEYKLTKIDYTEELQFMDDCYFGEGGFRDGTYLEQYPRESDDGFKFRKKIATFSDYFRAEFDALVDPIFSKNIQRTVENSSVKAYLADPRKRLGETMDTFMHNVTVTGLRLGTVFTVTTAPTEQAESAEDNTDSRFLAYSQIIKPQDIEGYILNEYGGIQTLVYLERSYVDENNKMSKEYRVWHDGDEGKLSFLVDSSGDITGTELDTFKYFPVEMFEFNTRYKETRIAKPKYYNVARKVLRDYLLTSNVDDGFWKNCFALLVYHGKADNLEIGNDQVLQAPIDATTPSFIAPPTEHLDKMETTMEGDKKSSQESMTSASAVALTASAQARMEVDRRRREILQGLSEKVQTYDLAIVNVDVREYIEGNWEYTVTYPTDFDSVSSADTVQLYTDLANSGMVVDEVKKELGNKSIEILPNLTAKEKEDWININNAGELNPDVLPDLGTDIAEV